MALFIIVCIILDLIFAFFNLIGAALVAGGVIFVWVVVLLCTRNNPSEVEAKVNCLSSDNYVELLCHLLEVQGYTYIRRAPNDVNVVLGEKQGVKHLWACLNSEINIDIVNRVWRIVIKYKTDNVKLCYKGNPEAPVFNYADSIGMRLISNRMIAEKYIEARKSKALPSSIEKTLKVPLRVWRLPQPLTQKGDDEKEASSESSQKSMPVTQNSARTAVKPEEKKELSLEDVMAKQSIEVRKSMIKHYSGNSDAVIDTEPMEGGWVLYAKCSCKNDAFKVDGYNNNNEWQTDFVYADTDYEGISWDYEQETAFIQVKASDEWVVEIRPLSLCETVSASKPYEGKGNMVLMLSGKRNRATIEKKGSEDFSVESYSFDAKDGSFNYEDCLAYANTDYSGTVLLADNPDVLAVKAEDNWEITIK